MITITMHKMISKSWQLKGVMTWFLVLFYFVPLSAIVVLL